MKSCSEPSNLLEHHSHIRVEFVCAGGWVVLRAVDD